MKFFFALMFAASVARAELEPKDFVVKVASIPLIPGARGSEGSGVVVHHKNKTYVLTSEHVVLHDKTGDSAYNTYQTEGETTSQKLRFIESDWGMGLALLEIENAPAREGFELRTLSRQASPPVNGAAWTLGFPYGSRSLVADPEGHVQSTTTESAILSEVTTMIQSEGGHAEFGMSGGALIDDNLNVIGILSHELPGTTKTVYSIPISLAAKWALNVLEDPSFHPRLIRNSYDRTNGTRYDMGGRVRSGPFLISYNKNDKKVEICVSRENAYRRADPMWNVYLNQMAAAVKESIDRDGHVAPLPCFIIPYFRPANLLDYQKPKTKFANLIEFLRNFDRTDVIPMVYLRREGSYPPNEEYTSDQFFQSIRSYQRGGGDKLRKYMAALADLTEFWEGGGSSFDRVRSYPISYTRSSEIDDMLNDPSFNEGWREAGRYNGNPAALRRVLGDYRDFLKRIGL